MDLPLLQITESLSTLTRYDDSDIVKGIIICFVLMAAFMTVAGTVYVKFFRVKFDQIPSAKVDLTVVEAMEITTTMAEKILKMPVDGHTVEKRISKLHHDTAQALKNSDSSTVAWMELANGQKKFMELIKDHYKEQSQRYIENHKESLKIDKEHHEEKMELQISLNKKILELARI